MADDTKDNSNRISIDSIMKPAWDRSRYGLVGKEKSDRIDRERKQRAREASERAAERRTISASAKSVISEKIDAILNREGFYSNMHALDCDRDRQVLFEIADIISPTASKTYLQNSSIARWRFWKAVIAGKYYIPQDPTGERQREDEQYLKKMENIKTVNSERFSKIQLANDNMTKWNNMGFYSYLRCMHTVSYLMEDIKDLNALDIGERLIDICKTNTSKLGLLNDKGFVGYINNTFKGGDFYDKLAFLYDMDVKDVLKIVNFVKDSCYDQLRSKVYPVLNNDLGLIQSKVEKNAIANEPLNSLIEGADTSVKDIFNVTAKWDASVTLVQNSCIGVLPRANEFIISLYHYKGMLYTGTSSVKMSCVDALQGNNSISLDCLDLIMTILNRVLLAAYVPYKYWQGRNAVPYTALFKDFYGKRLGDNVYTIKKINDYTYKIETLPTLFPFYAVQRGDAANSDIGIYLYDLDGILAEDKQKTRAAYLARVGHTLPTEIHPVAQFFKDEENIYFKSTQLEYSYTYKVSDEFPLLSDLINYLGIEEYDAASKEEVAKISSEELSENIFNQVKDYLLEVFKEIFDVKINNRFSETRCTGRDKKIEILREDEMYKCPVRIETNKNFEI